MDGESTKTLSILVCSLLIASNQTSSLPVMGPDTAVVAAAVVVAAEVVVLVRGPHLMSHPLGEL